MVELFQRWKEKHRKVYRHSEEAERRFENFKRNLKYILEKNNGERSRSENGHKLGLNRFADMSNEEFRKVYLSRVKRPGNKTRNPISRSLNGKSSSCDAPSSLDWRKKGAVTGVKDQGDCGKFFCSLRNDVKEDRWCSLSSVPF